MQVIEQTETKLVFQLNENQFLYTGLQIGGGLVFIGILLLGADFRTNSNYEFTSAQNLNFFMKILASLSISIGLALSFSAIKNQDNAYIFDKETSTFRITGKRWKSLYSKKYPISYIKEVMVNKTTFTQPNTLSDDYSYSTIIPSPDEFFISLRLGKEILSEATEEVFLLYKSPNLQLMNGFAETIRKFLEIAA
jgi:hypothetical protein